MIIFSLFEFLSSNFKLISLTTSENLSFLAPIFSINNKIAMAILYTSSFLDNIIKQLIISSLLYFTLSICLSNILIKILISFSISVFFLPLIVFRHICKNAISKD